MVSVTTFTVQLLAALPTANFSLSKTQFWEFQIQDSCGRAKDCTALKRKKKQRINKRNHSSKVVFGNEHSWSWAKYFCSGTAELARFVFFWFFSYRIYSLMLSEYLHSCSDFELWYESCMLNEPFSSQLSYSIYTSTVNQLASFSRLKISCTYFRNCIYIFYSFSVYSTFMVLIPLWTFWYLCFWTWNISM
jgi:hypothetical protein